MALRKKVRGGPYSAWLGVAPVLVLAALFGALILPRLGGGPEGHAAPDFALPVISGGEPGARVRLSEQRGKLVLLDFWASWCGPCREQAEVLKTLVAKGTSNVVVIGIDEGDARAAAERYLTATRPPWIVLDDAEQDAGRAYRVEALPTLVAIDRDGRVFAVRRHFMPESELSALLAAMGG